MKILCLGEICLENYHLADGCEKKFIGGCSFNQWIAMNQFPTRAQLLAPIGDDSISIKVKKKLKSHEFSELVTLQSFPGQLPQQEIKIKSAGEKSFEGYRAGVLNQLKVPDLYPFDIVVSSLYLQSLPLIRKVFRQRRPGYLVIDLLDYQDFAPDLDLLRECLRQADCIQLGLHNTKDFEFFRKVRELLWLFKKDAVITFGESGVKIFEQGREFEYGLLKPVQAIDTTGAGDCFMGTFLACKGLGKGRDEAVKMAQLRASEAVLRIGGAGVPLS